MKYLITFLIYWITGFLIVGSIIYLAWNLGLVLAFPTLFPLSWKQACVLIIIFDIVGTTFKSIYKD